jgi:NIMA-interacting peptidyl-prolyl cis-trans isomerase 1
LRQDTIKWRFGQVGWLCLALTALGCGSAPANPTVDSKAVDSPEQACFARANAKHEKKPDEPASIRVRHVLVKHRDSKSPGGATRSRGEACLRAEEALAALTHGAKLDDVVGTYSDSKGANGDGDLGSVSRDGLEPAFADAAFELASGQLSNVVETPNGFHVIARTE